MDSIEQLASTKIGHCQKIVETMAQALKSRQVDYYKNLKNALNRELNDLDYVINIMNMAKIETERQS
jgi:BMFP domain-containing protein YqiC